MHIKALSKQALSKLKRGLPARVMAGEGMQLVVMPHQFSAISRAFIKNKGMNVALSPPEVEANMVDEISGEGIFGKKADKFFEKKGIKKVIYKTGAALKPLAMEAIDAAASAAEAYGVPAPLIDLVKKETKGYIDKPEDYQTKKGQRALLKRTGKVAGEVATPYLEDAGVDMQQVKDAAKLARELKKGAKSSGPPMTAASLKGDAEEAFLSTLQTYMDKRTASKSAPQSTNPWDLVDKDGIIGNGVIQDIRKTLRTRGDIGGMGLYAGASSGRGLGMGLYAGGCMGGCMGGEGFKTDLRDMGKRFVNSGRKMVGTGHPSLESQNLDANFFMQNQYPPSYQRRR